MKALIADKFEQSGLEGLAAIGYQVAYEPSLKGDELGKRMREDDWDVLVVRSTQITREMLDGVKIEVIIRAGAGVNTIDVAAASELGIRVANCPGKNSIAVAELAFGLMLAVDRRIPDNVAELRAGRWKKAEFSKARGLHGRTLGLIGMGAISQEMIPRAKAFGMYVVGISRWMTPEAAAALGIGRAASLEELAYMSDVVSVHVSLNNDTRGLLNREFFEKLRPGSMVINTSRAEVMDQEALLWALDERKVWAGLDVFEGEPEGGEGTYSGPLQNHPRVYCTHHIGASTEQAQEAIAQEVVRICREYRLNGTVPNAVNVKPRQAAATHLVVVRHLDRVGVLAHVLGVLKDEGVNVQEMENIVLGGAKSAIAQISVDKNPSPDALLAIKMNPNVFDASAIQLG